MCESRFEHIHVIINPAAGGSLPVLKTLNSVFQPRGARWSVSVTNRQGDGRRLAADALASGADLIAALGGDGTLMDVVGGMIGSAVPLAYLPGGTGNVMAAELNIPRRLDLAAELIFDPNAVARPLDLGAIGDGHFIMRASVGFEANVVEKTSRELKDRFGLLAYGISILSALGGPLNARYRLTLDHQVVETEGASLLIANAGSIGRLNLSLGSTIEPDDGLLDVLLVNTAPNSVLTLAASLIQLDEMTAALQHYKTRRVTVESDPVQNVQVDGDLLGQTPVTAEVLPGAVRVLVPGG
jgi:YegS/Rv2252/BmrU family lipid kinase